MTAQRDKLDAVLAEIDAILGESGPRLPWVMSNGVQQQRQMLAQARDLLVELRQAQASETPPLVQDLAPVNLDAFSDPTATAASQVLQALLQEMQYLRGQTMQILDPLRNEVAILKQQRELLLQEVRQLQQQRLELDATPGPSTSQWEEKLQQLTGHLEAHLNQQLQQSVKQLETSAANTYLLTQQQGDTDATQPTLTPTQRLEYLKQIQSQSDQLVLNLDRVLRTVFDALQQSIYSYQDSLGHGLNKMHTLGQQGEMMFNALINHLAQQMNQDTLAYLESAQTRAAQPRQLPDAAAPSPLSNGRTSSASAPEPQPVESSEDWNFDDMDLDLELNDEDVTLLQIDDEISQLQLDTEGLMTAYDPTQELDDELTPPEVGTETASSEPSPYGKSIDPLQVLDQLDEAVPDPTATVSLPERLYADTLEAASISAGPNAGDADLDDLYQSIFGTIVAANYDLAPPGDDGSREALEAVPGSGTTADNASGAWDASFSAAAIAGDEDARLAADLDQVAALLEEEATADLADDKVALPPDAMAAPLGEASLDELFGDGMTEQLTETIDASADTGEEDTITSLDDLLNQPLMGLGVDASDFSPRLGDSDLGETETDPWSSDADFFAAATDEDLLASDDQPTAERYWLTVDQTLRDRLDEDLSGLESVPPAAEMPSPMPSPYDAGEGFVGVEPELESVYPPTSSPADASPEAVVDSGENVPTEETLMPPPAQAETVDQVFGSWDDSLVEPAPAANETVDQVFGRWDDSSVEPAPAANETVDQVFGDWPNLPGEGYSPTESASTPEALVDPVVVTDGELWPVDLEAGSEEAEADQENLESRFATFGEESPSPIHQDESPYRDHVPPYPLSSGAAPDVDAEANALVEDNRMPIGDLPSQESIEALLSDLNLSLGPDEPAIGESGLTLDALDTLAPPPVDQSRVAQPPKEPTLPRFTSGPPSRSQDSASRLTQPEGSPQVSDPSLTLENLLGELKLDPLFPGGYPDRPADDGSDAMDRFGDARGETPAEVDISTGRGGIDLFGEVSVADPTPTQPISRRIELFGEPPNAEPTPAAPEVDGGDLFGEAPGDEPVTDEPAAGIDLFGEAAFPSSEPGFLPTVEGIDLFGETANQQAMLDSEPDDTPPISLDDLDLTLGDDGPDFSLPALGEVGAEGGADQPAVSEDLFGAAFSLPGPHPAQRQLRVTAEGLFGDEFNDEDIRALVDQAPGPISPQVPETTEDLFGGGFGDEDIRTLVDQALEPILPEVQGATEDLFGGGFGDETLEPILPEVPETTEDLFGGGFGDETLEPGDDVPGEPTQPEGLGLGEGLFGDGFSGDASEVGQPEGGMAVTDLFADGFGEDIPEPEPSAESATDDSFTDDSLSEPLGDDALEWVQPDGLAIDRDLFADSFALEDEPSWIGEESKVSRQTPQDDITLPVVPPGQMEAGAASPGQDDTALKYTEWLSDISLETILGAAASDLEQTPPTGGADATVESFLVELDGAGEEVSSGQPEAEAATSRAASTEQDFLNLDALLDGVLEAEPPTPEGFDDSLVESSFGARQSFVSEVDVIDLDALLEPRDEGVNLPQTSEDDWFGTPVENGVTSVETFAEVSPLADSSQGPLPELPYPVDSTQETLPELPTPEGLPGAFAVDSSTLSSAEGDGDSSAPPSLPLEMEPRAGSEGAGNDAIWQDLAGLDGGVPEAFTAPEWEVGPGNQVGPGDVGAQCGLAEETLAAFVAIPASPDGPAQGDEIFVAQEAEPPLVPAPPQENPSSLWFLGLDIGAQGISAVLLQRCSGQVFPLYWVDTSISGATADKFFRLPTIASVGSGADEYPVQAVGSSALMVNWEDGDCSEGEEEPVLLKSLKPFLKMGVPLAPDMTAQLQPLIQWSDPIQLPLQTFQQALQELLTTLLQPLGLNSPLTIGAIGLESTDIAAALQDLQGVVVSYPANWPDTYPFNVREAIIRAGLIDRPDDIYFLEDAIAAVLSGLPDPAEPTPTASGQPVQQQTLYACHWTGGTVVISAGATVTEMGLANLPQPLGSLSYHDFVLHSMSYAGDAIDLDIICHLLHPPDQRQPRNPDRYRSPSNTEGWGWQAAMPELDTARWDDLDLDRVEFPRAAEPDLTRRYRLLQRLESSLLGQSLLEAVRHLKIILQHQPQFELELADQRWIVRSKDLEDRIILPYIQRINGHLNKLLSEAGLTTQGINQVICTGGSASLPKMSRWLRQKFPNATIIQDTYHSDRPPSCSRIAYGLVNLLRYPQVLDLTRHQYSDMFLLMELLRTFPDQPMPLSGILHLLKERGINTEACELHLIALLEGHLPPGLLPVTNNPMVSIAADDAELQALLTTPLFNRPNSQVYVPHPDQGQRLRAYMEALLADKAQTLMDPLLARLSALAV